MTGISDIELLELEKEFIYGIVFYPESIFQVSEILEPNDLLNETHAKIYIKAFEYALANKKYSSLDISEILNTDEFLYLTEIKERHFTAANIVPTARKLREYADSRRIRRQMAMVLNETNTAKEFTDKFERIVYELSASKIDGSLSLVDFPKVSQKIIEKAKMMGDIEGYGWGLGRLDQATGGIIPGKIYVIGGMKKSGKTKFTINIIHRLWEQDVPVLIQSLEMKDIALVRWLVARFSHRMISTDDYKFRGKLNIPQFEMTLERIISKDIIYIDDRPGLYFMQIKNQIWRQLNKGIKVVFIDYLQRMYIDSKKDTRATAIQKTVGYIADMAKEFNIAVVLLSQLANIAEGRMGVVGDLKESGGTAENANCVLILNNIDRIENNREKKKYQVWIDVEQRDGESKRIKCQTKLQFNEFFEQDEFHED